MTSRSLISAQLSIANAIDCLLTYQLLRALDAVMATFSSSFSCTSSSQNFLDGVNYALSKLGISHMKLKDQQKQVIMAAYDGKDVFVFLPIGFRQKRVFSGAPFPIRPLGRSD